MARSTWGGRWVARGAVLSFAGALSFAGCASQGTGATGFGGSDPSTSTSTSTSGGGHQDVCPGATLCGEACTNVAFDPANCGSCGHACKAGEVCSQSQCAAACGGGSKDCNGTCTNPAIDPDNCGNCGVKCDPGKVCSQSMCSDQCLGGTANCNNKCVDTQLDPSNCGMCGKTCNPGEVCSNGMCGVSCVGGSTLCNGACVDEVNDPANCGACAKQCAPGEVCTSSQCALFCGSGTAKCGNLCVDKLNDPKNCGACGKTCNAGQSCVNGTCGFCQPGFTQCNATCVNEKQDPKNCGGCNVVCAVGTVCDQGGCAATCSGGLSACGQQCLDLQKDPNNCGMCGKVCAQGESCKAGACQACDSATTDCDGDGWLVSDGDCCDKPGLCGANPELVNPGAIEVVGNGLDDNCNGKTDLFDVEDTIPCDAALMANSQNPLDFAKAIGLCRQTTEMPALLKDKTWGLIDAKLLRADGTVLQDFNSISIRNSFGSISPSTTEGQSVIVISSGIASDATQMSPGPNGGAPAGFNVSNQHNPPSDVNIDVPGLHSVSDWYATSNPPLKPAHGLPDSPGCNASNVADAQDSVMLYLRMRAPTNAKAFSFNSYFMSAEYPEFVCTNFNDQFIALVDTPGGVPKPIANPLDKNLLTYTQGGQQWPIGINIATGTSLFAVCDSQAANPGCWDTDVSAASCSLGSMQLTGTGFEAPMGDTCTIGGGTYWLTTAGNVIPGDIVELRIALWDVGDSSYDSLAVIDGFHWLPNATLPGTGN